MTKADINQFISSLRSDKEISSIRIKGDKKHPTKELGYRYSSVTHTPTIEIDRGQQTDLYEFEKNYAPSNLNASIAKWILFSIRAKKLSGQFYLVVNEKDKLKFTKIIREKSLDVELITLT